MSVSIILKQIDVPTNVLQTLSHSETIEKIKLVDKKFGIPKDLFKMLVKKHRPVHIQLLKLVFQILCIACLIFVAVEISYTVVCGPTSDMSEVMHVIFVVTIGALPKVLEIALSRDCELVHQEIEEREIEETVVEYWRNRERQAQEDFLLIQ